MGTAHFDAAGEAVVVAEGPEFTALPTEVEVTLEPREGSPAPSGPVMVHYTGH